MFKALNTTILISLSSLSLAYASEINSVQTRLNLQPIHYYKIGNSGSPLILLTGYATTSNFWNSRFVECLATQHQVYLFDYPGINTPQQPFESQSLQTMANGVTQLAKQLQLQNPALIGWSMGGGVALQASFDLPEYYKHLYLLAPIVPSPAKPILIPHTAPAKFNSATGIYNFIFNNNLAAYNQASLSTLQAQFITPQLAALFPSQAIIAQQGPAITEWVSNPANAAAFKHDHVPASFYIPGKDKILQQTIVMSVIESYPNATIISAPNSGHAIAWDEAQPVCQSILADSRN